MKLRVFVEPQQGATYDEILAAALLCERVGFDGFFRSDHFLRMGTERSGPGPGPTDAWITLAGLARDTTSIRIGTLVTSATFRHPGVLAIQVAQVDAMSAGRVELGIGAGWFEEEHRTLGVRMPEDRFGALEEQLELLRGLWATSPGDTFSYDGAHVQVQDSPALPKPVQSLLPIIIGGAGPRRTPRLAAQFATEFNLPFPAFSEVEKGFERVASACEAIGRDPRDLLYSVAEVGLVGRTENEFRVRAEGIGRDPGELRERGIVGTPAEARDRLAQLAAAGVDTLYLQIWNLQDLDHLSLIAEELLV